MACAQRATPNPVLLPLRIVLTHHAMDRATVNQETFPRYLDHPRGRVIWTLGFLGLGLTIERRVERRVAVGTLMAIGVAITRIVLNITVEVQRLWVSEDSVGDRDGFWRPVG